MKNIYRSILGLSMVLLLFSCKKEMPIQNSFVLEADIEGIEGDYLVYSEKNDNAPDGWLNDTLWIKDNKFKFEHAVSDYEMFFINVPKASRVYKVKYGDKEYTASTKANVNRLWFLAYPGGKIEYKGKMNGYIVDAYPLDAEGINEGIATVHKAIFPLLDNYNAISVELSTNRELDDEGFKKLQDSSKNIYEQINAIKSSYIQSHPNTVAATYFLKDMFYRKELSLDQVKVLYNAFDESKLSGTSFYKEIGERLDAIEKTKIGMQAPEIQTTHTLDGSEFRLSSLKGNYVLMDYWGLWCGPCMAEMPKIKEYFSKYSDKNFMVLGVNSGDTNQKWKNAVAEREFNWMHIQTTKENDLLVPFNVNSFPTKILIDPEGKIIYNSNNIEEKVDLYQLLDSLFSNPE